MTSPTGSPAKRPKPEEWSFEIEIRFVQVQEARREAYWSFLSRLAEQIQDLTAPEAMEAVSGQGSSGVLHCP